MGDGLEVDAEYVERMRARIQELIEDLKRASDFDHSGISGPLRDRWEDAK